MNTAITISTKSAFTRVRQGLQVPATAPEAPLLGKRSRLEMREEEWALRDKQHELKMAKRQRLADIKCVLAVAAQVKEDKAKAAYYADLVATEKASICETLAADPYCEDMDKMEIINIGESIFVERLVAKAFPSRLPFLEAASHMWQYDKYIYSVMGKPFPKRHHYVRLIFLEQENINSRCIANVTEYLEEYLNTDFQKYLSLKKGYLTLNPDPFMGYWEFLRSGFEVKHEMDERARLVAAAAPKKEEEDEEDLEEQEELPFKMLLGNQALRPWHLPPIEEEPKKKTLKELMAPMKRACSDLEDLA